ncbi:hypothetical protein ACFL3G_00580 [Planctomycetota bacterium]
MRKKTLIICLFITIVSITFTNCQAVETQYKPKVQFSKQIDLTPENIDTQLQDIETRSLKKREQIKNRYLQRFEQLQLLAEAQAKKLTYPERMRWVEFIKMIEREPATNNDLLRSGFLENKIYKLHAAMLDSYSLSAMQDLLLDENTREIIAYFAENNKHHSSLLREQARKILVIMNDLQSRSARLEKQWDYSLANLEQWGKNQAEFILRATNQTTVKAKTPGTVTAILRDNKSYLAMIDGKLVRETETIKGVKVAKITPDSVQFKKMLKKWTQKLGQPPKESW